MESVPGQWNKQFAVNVGGFTLGLVRIGSRFFNVPAEPKAALESLRGAEAGVYRLRDAPSALDYRALLTVADKSMTRRGWERIVGVTERGQFVAVYMPRKAGTLTRVEFCVVVLDDGQLVVASGRGNPEPLIELATRRLDGRHDLFSGKFKRGLPGIQVGTALLRKRN